MHPILNDIDLVTFDLDGTLVDSVPDLAVAVAAAITDLDLASPSEARVRDWVGNGSLMLMERALRHALLVVEPPLRPVPGASPEAPSDDHSTETIVKALLERAHSAFLDHYGRDPSSRTRLYPGVLEGLEGLRERGFLLTLVTNKPFAFIAPILEGFGIHETFSLCLGGDSLPLKKPDPAPLLHVAAHFGVSPARCLMVGDSRHDIAAGRAAGFRTLAVPYGYNHGEPVSASRPDAVVDSLSQLV